MKSCFNNDSLRFCNCVIETTVKTFKRPKKVTKDNPIPDISVCIDINKCFSSILAEPDTKWILFDIMDEPQRYDMSDIRDDTIYYIEPTHFNPLVYQFGVYYPNIVRRALEDNLITKHHIKYTLKGKVVKTEVFKKFENFTYQILGDKYGKVIVNHFIGSLGTTTTSVGSVEYGSDLNSMASKMFCYKDVKQFLFEVAKDGNKKLYSINNIKKVDSNKNLEMIRKQIVQTGNLRSYELYKKMTVNGGELAQIKTDMVEVFNSGSFDLELSNTRGGYKIEDKPRRYSDVSNVIEGTKRAYYKMEKELHKINIDDEYDFEEIFDKTENKSFFLSALGNCGKSYIINKYIDRLELLGKKVLILALTHTAKKGLGGRTLHNAFCFDHNMNRTGKYNFSSIDTFIFDEISMCGSIFIEK